MHYDLILMFDNYWLLDSDMLKSFLTLFGFSNDDTMHSHHQNASKPKT